MKQKYNASLYSFSWILLLLVSFINLINISDIIEYSYRNQDHATARGCLIGVKNKQREIESDCSLCPKCFHPWGATYLFYHSWSTSSSVCLHLSLATSCSFSVQNTLSAFCHVWTCAHMLTSGSGLSTYEIMKRYICAIIIMLFYLQSNVTINFTELAMNTSCNLECLLCFVWRRRWLFHRCHIVYAQFILRWQL